MYRWPVFSCLLIAGAAAAPGLAQGLGSLRNVKVPEPPDLERYVRDRDTLVALGKALFWDMQVGSDGRTACATCHFHAGADHRRQNQLSDPTGSVRANHLQTLDEFPFRVFANTGDNRSEVVRDSSQRAGSSGVFRRLFASLSGEAAEAGLDASDAPAFRVQSFNVRQVTTRNTPSAINAVFYVRNFWDGRASDIFTGLTPFGDSDTRANNVAVREGRVVAERVRIANSSLASQAVGPPLNGVEMSYDGRTWTQLARKLLPARPLAAQKVAPDDGVLGRYADPEGRGFRAGHSYLSLIQAAFQPAWWDWPDVADDAGRTVAEINFPLFFGLAIQAYEATLVSDQSRFDRFSEGDSAVLSAQEQAGLQAFRRAECTDCHLGAEFTFASYTALAQRGAVNRFRNLVTDTGFIHTGVRPSAEDSGLQGTDDFGASFSVAARQNPGAALGIGAAFKTPGLRNVEFTGPYFHNGGQATLEQVVEFYNRGGDFPNAPTLSNDVKRQNLNTGERAALVEFLKALSDDRVRFERAPFDHPEICVPTGYADPPAGDPGFVTSAVDRWAAIPAVGQKGNSVPLQTFVELLQGVGSDGSRAHSLAEPCAIP